MITGTLPKETPYLRQLDLGERLMIGPCDGQRSIVGVRSDFRAQFDDNLEKLESGTPTPQVEVVPYELTRVGTFEEFIDSLLVRKDELVWEQDQILEFLIKYRKHLSQDEHGNDFLVKVGEEYLVVFIYVRVDGYPGAGLYPLGRNWKGLPLDRFFVLRSLVA